MKSDDLRALFDRLDRLETQRSIALDALGTIGRNLAHRSAGRLAQEAHKAELAIVALDRQTLDLEEPA